MSHKTSIKKHMPFLVEPKSLTIKRRNFSTINPLIRKLPQRKFLIVSKSRNKKPRITKNVNRSLSLEKKLQIPHIDKPKETLEKQIRDFREYTSSLAERVNLENEHFEDVKKENKKPGKAYALMLIGREL
jgi:hypothetical protein